MESFARGVSFEESLLRSLWKGFSCLLLPEIDSSKETPIKRLLARDSWQGVSSKESLARGVFQGVFAIDSSEETQEESLVRSTWQGISLQETPRERLLA